MFLRVAEEAVEWLSFAAFKYLRVFDSFPSSDQSVTKKEFILFKLIVKVRVTVTVITVCVMR